MVLIYRTSIAHRLHTRAPSPPTHSFIYRSRIVSLSFDIMYSRHHPSDSDSELERETESADLSVNSQLEELLKYVRKQNYFPPATKRGTRRRPAGGSTRVCSVTNCADGSRPVLICQITDDEDTTLDREGGPLSVCEGDVGSNTLHDGTVTPASPTQSNIPDEEVGDSCQLLLVPSTPPASASGQLPECRPTTSEAIPLGVTEKLNLTVSAE